MTTSAPRSQKVGIGATLIAAGLLAAHGWVRTRAADWDDAALVAVGALERSRVWDGELWRFLVAPLLFPDLRGLVVEVAGVLLAGAWLERRLGTAGLLATYAASAVGGGALALLGRDAVLGGTSAGALGLMGGLMGAVAASKGLERALAARLVPLALAIAADVAAPALAPAGSGWDLLDPGAIAQMGGLLAGWAVALPFTTAEPRWRARLHRAAAALALAAVVAAAAWPRPGPTAFQEDQLAARIHAALRAGDVPEASRLLADAEQLGMRGDRFTLYRALGEAHADRLEQALELLRPLRRGAPGPFRDEVDRQIAGIAYLLGYRHYSGEGRPLDPRAGLTYFEEACRAGSSEGCENVEWIRTGSRPDGTAP